MTPDSTRHLGRLTARTEAVCAELLTDVADDDAATRRVGDIRAGLADDLRLAVAGRLKAGKSTLVNAILSQRIAETDVGECTLVVTTFRHGFPESVTVRPRAGEPRTRGLLPGGRLPDDLHVAPADTAGVDVALSNDVLRGLVLVDTPGLASTTEEASRATTDLLAIDASSRDAVTGVEALVYVLARSPRDDDRTTLSTFRQLSAQAAGSAATCIAVLGRADEIGTSAFSVDTPLAAAHELAATHARTLAGVVDDVVPVSGLGPRPLAPPR